MNVLMMDVRQGDKVRAKNDKAKLNREWQQVSQVLVVHSRK